MPLFLTCPQYYNYLTMKNGLNFKSYDNTKTILLMLVVLEYICPNEYIILYLDVLDCNKLEISVIYVTV
jgi:hypothetical protein